MGLGRVQKGQGTEQYIFLAKNKPLQKTPFSKQAHVKISTQQDSTMLRLQNLTASLNNMIDAKNAAPSLSSTSDTDSVQQNCCRGVRTKGCERVRKMCGSVWNNNQIYII